MTADQIREVMGPEFCAVADDLRERFGAKLTWLKAGEFEIGKPPGGEPIGELAWIQERIRFWYGGGK